MKKKLIARTICLFVMMTFVMLLYPVTARADLSKNRDNYYSKGYQDPIAGITYQETSDGKVAVALTVNYSATKKNGIVFCAVEGRTVTQEMVAGSTFSGLGSGEAATYVMKHTFAPASKVGFYAYTIDNADYDPINDGDIIAAVSQTFDMPEIEKNPLDDIIVVDLAEGSKTYSGTFTQARRFNIYKLNVSSDAYLHVKNFTAASDGWLGIAYFEEDMKRLDTNYTYEEIFAGKGGEIKTGIAKTGGKNVYLVMDAGSKGASWSFDMEFRKYRHAHVTYTAKEGDMSLAFPQNTTLHITAKLTPANTDACFDKESYVTTPGSLSGEIGDLKASKDGKSATFTVRSQGQADARVYTLHYRETNPEKVNEYYGYTQNTMDNEFTVTTGLSAMQLTPEVGYNFIKFSNFNLPEYGQGETADITVYLKNGKKWKKQFKVKAFTKTTKTIKKLKSNKKYTFKTEVVKKLNNGKKVKSSKNYTIKTGPGSAPPIKSIKVSNVAEKKSWSSGYWDSGWNWHSGHYNYYTTYTFTITLKKPVKGAISMDINGLRANKKNNTQYVLSSSVGGYKKGKSVKFTFRMVTNKDYGGYSKAVTKSVKLK